MKTREFNLVRRCFVLGMVLCATLVAFPGTKLLSQSDVSTSDPCVKISKWENCNNLCTNAICFKFKNECSNKVKINYSTQNEDKTWTEHETTLEANTETDDTMICPYIDMKWSYEEL